MIDIKTYQTVINAHVELIDEIKSANDYYEAAECYDSLRSIYNQMLIQDLTGSNIETSTIKPLLFTSIQSQCEKALIDLNDFIESESELSQQEQQYC